VRLFRSLLLFKLGFWAGMVAAGAFMKRALPSRGDETSDEVALTAIFNGVQLESRATAFRGGSMLSWWGGVAVDLKGATLAPESHLDIASLFGGVALRLPPGVRVQSNITSILGGVAIAAPEPDDPAAPLLVLDGFTLLGGVAVKSPAPGDDDQT
jgi:hypothetical protein